MENQIDSVITRALDEKRIVGTVVLIAKQGKVIYRKAHGFADREAGIPMTEETLFRLASLTKPITSLTALRLIDQKMANLNDSIRRWLPDFKPQLPDGSTPEITLLNLLNHTAGLNYPFLEEPHGPYHQLGISDGLNDAPLTLEENVQKIAQAPLIFAPGERWQYSMATDVLGRVIEKISGLDFKQAVKKYVTDPLEMAHTMFTAPTSLALAVPYANEQPEPVRMKKSHQITVESSVISFSPDRAYQPNAYPSGGSGMIGSADDYFTFLEAVRTHRLLKSDLNHQIFENTVGDASVFLAGPGWGWGLMSALLLDPVAAAMPMPKTSLGWSGVYGHTWWLDPVNEITAVLLTNTALEGMSGHFPEDIRAAVYS